MCDIFITFLRFLYAISRCGSGVGTHEINESAIRNRSLKKRKEMVIQLCLQQKGYMLLKIMNMKY